MARPGLYSDLPEREQYRSVGSIDTSTLAGETRLLRSYLQFVESLQLMGARIVPSDADYDRARVDIELPTPSNILAARLAQAQRTWDRQARDYTRHLEAGTAPEEEWERSQLNTWADDNGKRALVAS